MMRKYLQNDRGSIPFVTAFVVAMIVLLALLMMWVSAEIHCIGIKNNVKNELTNVSIRISEDTYKAMREGNLDEYYRTLTHSSSYRNELKNLVKTKITETMPLETESYKIDDINLRFEENGDNIEYIFTCDVEYYVSLFGDQRTIRKDAIEFSGKHSMKNY